MSVFDKVKEVFAEQLYYDEDEMEQITLGATIWELGVDDLDLAEVITACEDVFDIAIDDHDVEAMETVKDLVDYIQANI